MAEDWKPRSNALHYKGPSEHRPQ